MPDDPFQASGDRAANDKRVRWFIIGVLVLIGFNMLLFAKFVADANKTSPKPAEQRQGK